MYLFACIYFTLRAKYIEMKWNVYVALHYRADSSSGAVVSQSQARDINGHFVLDKTIKIWEVRLPYTILISTKIQILILTFWSDIDIEMNHFLWGLQGSINCFLCLFSVVGRKLQSDVLHTFTGHSGRLSTFLKSSVPRIWFQKGIKYECDLNDTL